MTAAGVGQPDGVTGGWLASARQRPSPNWDQRPPGVEVDLLVIHAISLPPGAFGGEGVERLFTNRLDPDAHPFFRSIEGLRVSAHLFIRRDGTLYQFVPLYGRAWHAGQSSFAGRPRCNDFSVGIELEGTDHHPYTPAQYRRLGRTAAAVMAACPGIARDRIAGHADIAPDRKTDPGRAFDWQRFYAELDGARV
ncbi:1,6-anhydro-N-acetylmuramyl-L-alanine amidase AmpD [Thiohalospira sp.]|uniref:1,6-anhydro-N-acetylmuramyl-L-alanine amidase AmpD n=1 Tax=Thiohalospira sp. TaxID=3080549 RepID=UPI003981060D